MSLTFKEEGHLYESIDPNDGIKWTSVTSLVGKFKPPFDSDKIAEKCSKNKKSKWYGLKPKAIQKIWAAENKRAITLGTFYHNQREADLMSFNTLTRDGVTLIIVPPVIEEGIKYAPDQKLSEGVYPEHFVYLKSAEVCGQADRVEVVNGRIDVNDYKTNKEIKQRGFVSWDGVVSTLDQPLGHVEDCSLQHYTLQMSIYLYIMLKHNPKLRPGKLTLEHIIFEKEGTDEYGYPIIKYTQEGDPIVEEVVLYEVPYLKEEVMTMINWLKDNK